MLGVGQADKRVLFFSPLAGESFLIFRADDEDLGVALYELLIVLTQLRQMPAAMRSGKAAGEDQDDVLSVTEIGQADRLPLEIVQREVGSGGGGQACHRTRTPV
jgi:hypothetical protein